MDASYLLNKSFPKLSFHSTSGVEVPNRYRSVWLVIYVYPMIPQPETVLPEGWLSIPSAAGCTAQSCSFRDHFPELKRMNLKLLGLSSQSIKQQIKIKERLKLPFELISDEGLILKRLFDLPTFCVDGAEYYERLTLVIRDGMIKNVFYPVSSPQTHVHEVVDWLRKTDQKDVMEGIHDSGN